MAINSKVIVKNQLKLSLRRRNTCFHEFASRIIQNVYIRIFEHHVLIEFWVALISLEQIWFYSTAFVMSSKCSHIAIWSKQKLNQQHKQFLTSKLFIQFHCARNDCVNAGSCTSDEHPEWASVSLLYSISLN